MDCRICRRPGDGPDGLLRLPQGAPTSISALGRATLPQHPVLERAGQGRALRGIRATGAVHRRCPRLLSLGSIAIRLRPVPVNPVYRAPGGGRGRELGRLPRRLYDALAESVIGLYEAELIERHKPWRSVEA